jgi:hypothetical protein
MLFLVNENDFDHDDEIAFNAITLAARCIMINVSAITIVIIDAIITAPNEIRQVGAGG